MKMCFAPWGLDAPQAPRRLPGAPAPESLSVEPLRGFRAEHSFLPEAGRRGVPNSRASRTTSTTVIIQDLTFSRFLNILFKSAYFFFYSQL